MKTFTIENDESFETLSIELQELLKSSSTFSFSEEATLQNGVASIMTSRGTIEILLEPLVVEQLALVGLSRMVNTMTMKDNQNNPIREGTLERGKRIFEYLIRLQSGFIRWPSTRKPKDIGREAWMAELAAFLKGRKLKQDKIDAITLDFTALSNQEFLGRLKSAKKEKDLIVLAVNAAIEAKKLESDLGF